MNITINQLIRSKRKSLMLQIKSDGSLIVRAPMKLDIDRINRFIKQKSNWIITKQLKIKKQFLLQDQMLQQQKNHTGDGVLFLGKRQNILPKHLKTRQETILWYKQEALKNIAPQALYYAENLQVKFGRIKITSARKRWGSCSGKNNLNFSWRLIMAPQEVVNYVIAHEVAHLLHKNHSKKFWSCVESIIPDYKNHHIWLRRNGFLLDF